MILKRFFNKLSIENKEKIKKLLNFNVCKEYYRIDIGLIITRPPIFLHYDDKELENFELDHKIKKKYNYYNKIPKEILDFDLEDPFLSNIKKNPDNNYTHSKTDSNGEKIYYSGNSKIPFLTDPNIQDNKSIQNYSMHNVFLLIKKYNEWNFPNYYLKNTETIQDSIENYINNLNNTELKIKFNDNKPFCVIKEDILKDDLEKNQIFSKCMGRKIFYYYAYHFTGVININVDYADDYVWVPKHELKNFLSENKIKKFINILTNY